MHWIVLFSFLFPLIVVGSKSQELVEGEQTLEQELQAQYELAQELVEEGDMLKGDIKSRDNRLKAPEKYQEALALFKELAEQGHVLSQYMVGQLYYSGRPEEDFEKAFDWFSKAAKQGNSDAQHDLGLMYAQGDGVYKDNKKALNFFSKSAQQGNPKGQGKVGMMHYEGRGTYRNYEVAASWFDKAARNGDALSRLSLAYMHFEGEGVDKNRIKAYMWGILSSSSQLHAIGLKGYRGDFLKKLKADMTYKELKEARMLAKQLNRNPDLEIKTKNTYTKRKKKKILTDL